jgi:hypothetical protein
MKVNPKKITYLKRSTSYPMDDKEGKSRKRNNCNNQI